MSNLVEIQKKIDDILQDYEKPYWNPLSNVARLVEEVGEVARIINHRYGDKPKKPTEQEDDLEDELADVLWTVICLANQEGVDLDKGITRAINKLLQSVIIACPMDIHTDKMMAIEATLTASSKIEIRVELRIFCSKGSNNATKTKAGKKIPMVATIAPGQPFI